MIIQEQQPIPGKNPHTGQSFYDNSDNMLGDVVTPTPSVQQEQPVRTAKDITRDIFSAQMPQPTYDANRPEEIKRIAKLNAIGEGLKTIGDFVSLGVGANVRRREPDRTTPQLLSQLWQNVDKANAQKDNWNWQNYLAKIRNLNMELGQKNREDDIARQEKYRTEDITHRDAREKIADTRYDDNLERVKAWREGGGEFENWKKKVAYQFGLDMQKLDKRMTAELAKYSAKANFSGKKFTLYDDQGNAVKVLDPGELEKVTQMVLKDPAVSELAKKDISLMKAQFGAGLSKQALQTITAYYWDKSPMVQEYLKGSQKQVAPAVNYSPSGQAEQNKAIQDSMNKIGNIYNLGSSQAETPSSIYSF